MVDIAVLLAEAVALEAKARRIRQAVALLAEPRKAPKKAKTPALNARNLIRESGLTYGQVAAQIGYKNSDQVANVVSGRTRSAPMLARIATLLGKPLSEVVRPV